jgi:hypothetical protein
MRLKAGLMEIAHDRVKLSGFRPQEKLDAPRIIKEGGKTTFNIFRYEHSRGIARLSGVDRIVCGALACKINALAL